MDPNTLGAQFTSAAQAYANGIQPYAENLFFALLFIEILVTCIQYLLDQADAVRYLSRAFRHLLSAGFIYLMLVNAFPWMTGIMHSFSAIGVAISGAPNLNPGTVLGIGGQMAETIYQAPTNPGGMFSDLSLALGQTAAAFFILLSFTIIAALALLVVIEAYLVIGGASILLAFGGNRFTAPIAEGYFGHVIKVGVRLLFFYLVLGIGVRIATGWNAAITAACVPTTATLPWYATYGVPPSKIMTTVCSAPLNWHLLLMLVANSVILMIVTTVVPSTAAGIVSGTAGLALNHAFEAAFITKTVVSPLANSMQTIMSRAVRSFGGSDSTLDSRFRANESIQPPKPPSTPTTPGIASHVATTSWLSTQNNVDSRTTRPLSRVDGNVSTNLLRANGNSPQTAAVRNSDKGTTKI